MVKPFQSSSLKKLKSQEKKHNLLTIQHQWKASTIVPNADVSRNLLSHLRDLLARLNYDTDFLNTQVCRKCSSFLNPSNMRVRFTPKPKLKKRELSTLKKLARQGGSSKRKRLGRKVLKSSSTLRITCFVCDYLHRQLGASYSEIISRRKKEESTSVECERQVDSNKKMNLSEIHSNVHRKNRKIVKKEPPSFSSLERFLESL